jgi:membrane-bound lytic murein transglycosylase D
VAFVSGLFVNGNCQGVRMVLRFVRPALPVAVALAIAGCGSRLQTKPPAVTPTPPPVQVAPAPVERPAPVEDPIAVLIQTSQKHFEAGQQELSIGHLDRARQQFNRALDVLLQSPYGARYDARLREHFDRLVDRISAYEVSALAEGDGFTEKTYEPASIDSLLDLSTADSPAPSPALKQAVASDLASTQHDVPIPLNARVLAYIDLFQGRLREWIADGLSRGARYLPMIQNVFRAEGLPLDLAYVPLIESAFRPNAVSRAKAKGVWQFMAGTAAEHGLKRDWYVDERFDPEKATRAAAKYLQTLVGFFGGDWHLALASYNGGPGLVQRALHRGRVEDFWSLSAKPRLLPRETREYVPMILAAIVIARNPAQYGFTAESTPPPLEYDKVAVPRPVDLRRIAEWAGITVTEIQDLNPELRRWTTPVKYPDYQIKVPKGTGQSIEQRLADLAAEDLAPLQWYSVKKGDTLTTIARKLRVARTDLSDANYLSAKAQVSPGQKLIIPVEPTLLLAGRADRPTPVGDSRAVVSAGRIAEAPSAVPPDKVKLVYLVKPGDTLSSVARLFRTTVESLKVWNRMRGDRITPGARLTVYSARANNRP